MLRSQVLVVVSALLGRPNCLTLPRNHRSHAQTAVRVPDLHNSYSHGLMLPRFSPRMLELPNASPPQLISTSPLASPPAHANWPAPQHPARRPRPSGCRTPMRAAPLCAMCPPPCRRPLPRHRPSPTECWPTAARLHRMASEPRAAPLGEVVTGARQARAHAQTRIARSVHRSQVWRRRCETSLTPAPITRPGELVCGTAAPHAHRAGLAARRRGTSLCGTDTNSLRRASGTQPHDGVRRLW